MIPNPANPQSLNRFSYVRNNPLIFIDPTGHTECRLEPEECRYLQNLENNNSGGGSTTSSTSGSSSSSSSSSSGGGNGNSGSSGRGDKLDFTGYSDWEQDVLVKLHNDGGPNAVYGVDYILANNIHITVGSGWQSGGGTRGAWYKGKLIVLNVDMGYEIFTMPDAWGLSNVIHEAKHIEQGKKLAFSQLGEMEAWQIGIDVAEHLGWYDTRPLAGRDFAVKNAKDVLEFSKAIQDHDKPYWNAFQGTPLESLICMGLCALPYYPYGIMSGQ